MNTPSRLDADRLQQYVDASRADYEAKLAQLVEIPSVSMEPARRADVVRGAELAAQYLRAAGGRAEVVPTGGHPVVFGEIDVGAPRTLTIYNHIDVQPAERADGWAH